MMNHFPVLDAPRDEEPGRTIMDTHAAIEPYVPEMDYWVSMPVRLAHSQLAGWCIEVGPYTLGRSDIERLRAAINSYDLATRGATA